MSGLWLLPNTQISKKGELPNMKHLRTKNQSGGTMLGTVVLTACFAIGLLAAKDNFEQVMQTSTEARFANNTVAYPEGGIYFQLNGGNSSSTSSSSSSSSSAPDQCQAITTCTEGCLVQNNQTYCAPLCNPNGLVCANPN